MFQFQRKTKSIFGTCLILNDWIWMKYTWRSILSIKYLNGGYENLGGLYET